jgi:rare lipoprotein A
MVVRRKSPNWGFKIQLGICLLTGALAGLIVAVVVPDSTRPVQADTRLTSAVIATPTAAPVSAISPVNAPTPVLSGQAKPVKRSRADILRGIASWYGAVLDGHRTASGERFDMYAMTACHPTLPFGTLVRVIDLNTKKSVVVRINDRGQLSDGRVIDLSYAAAKELNITKAGLAPVALEIVSLGLSRQKK